MTKPTLIDPAAFVEECDKITANIDRLLTDGKPKMDDAEYHAHDAVSKTKLNHFAKSIGDYWHYYIAKDLPVPGPSGAMNIGTAVHAALLEKCDVDQIIATYPDSCLKSNGAINPKPAAQFREDNSDKLVMKDADADRVREVCSAVMTSPLSPLIYHPEAVFEQPVIWTCERTGLQCRAKPDFYIDMGDEVVAYDLKTTEQVYPQPINRTCKTLRYWLQDAHYSDGLANKFGKPVRFRFWFVETKSPCRVAPWWYDQRSREIASEKHSALMTELAACMKDNDWRERWERNGENLLQLSPWDVDASEEGEVAYVGEE